MTSRAIILKENKILLIHRFKNGSEYFVIPGGHIKKTESEKEALIREIKEETNLDIKINKYLWTLKNNFSNLEHVFFLVTEFLGDIKLKGPELEKNCEENKYILEWHDIKNITKLNLIPKSIKKKIVDYFIK